MNIRNWLQEFEEMAELCDWTDVQKIIYAKRQLRSSAKMFVLEYIDEWCKLCDEEINKTVLYGAKNVRELKENFTLYEMMKENMIAKGKLVEEKLKKSSVRNETEQKAVRRYYLCGDWNYLTVL
ncbi:unnamed protein product [Heterotrigona itama]|uniref:Uncharacterized protein n=1 Tax=Heterotrigona itama TaxID=395501 RepID=A0A6V7GZR1_9HYME|nr:unnamed protein product [Heterotrigona itama]